MLIESHGKIWGRAGQLLEDQTTRQQRERRFERRCLFMFSIKVMLHGTIRNDDFYRNTALQCWNNVVTIQNNVAMLCCAKSRRCKSLRVTSP